MSSVSTVIRRQHGRVPQEQLVTAVIVQVTFNWKGFLSAMGSNITFQSRNVLSKKFMTKGKLTVVSDMLCWRVCPGDVMACSYAMLCREGCSGYYALQYRCVTYVCTTPWASDARSWCLIGIMTYHGRTRLPRSLSELNPACSLQQRHEHQPQFCCRQGWP